MQEMSRRRFRTAAAGSRRSPSNTRMVAAPNRVSSLSIAARSVVIRTVSTLEMPYTIRKLLDIAIARLKQADINEPELSAKYLLQYVLGKNGIELQLAANEQVSASDIRTYDDLINKRLDHTPVQYLLGYVDFYNIKLQVDSRALIPRPETEELVDYLLKEVGKKNALRILDIGTGTGNIAIALAANLDNPEITALDISTEALSLAEQNARNNELHRNINFVCGDVFDDAFWNDIGTFDIIVSNPPYIDSSDFDSLQAEVQLFEPRTALISDGDVLAFYKVIASKAKSHLNENGILCFEIGMGQEADITEIIGKNIPSITIEQIHDLSGIPRIIIAKL